MNDFFWPNFVVFRALEQVNDFAIIFSFWQFFVCFRNRCLKCKKIVIFFNQKSLWHLCKIYFWQTKLTNSKCVKCWNKYWNENCRKIIYATKNRLTAINGVNFRWKNMDIMSQWFSFVCQQMAVAIFVENLWTVNSSRRHSQE